MQHSVPSGNPRRTVSTVAATTGTINGNKYPFVVLVDAYTGATVARQSRTFEVLSSAVDYANRIAQHPRTRRVQVLAVLSDNRVNYGG